MSLNFGCCAPAFGKQMTATSMASQPMTGQSMSARKMPVNAPAATTPALKFQGSIVADALFHNTENHNSAPKFGRFLEGLRVPEGISSSIKSSIPRPANGGVNYLA